MFNDILTGKASLEEKPKSADPYREESVPDITATCNRCHKAFLTKAGTSPAYCGPCKAIVAQSNAALSAQQFANVNANIRSSDNGYRILRVGIMIVIGIGLAIFKSGMRHSYEQDTRSYDYEPSYTSTPAYSSHYSSDPFAVRVKEFANQMCSCSDLRCASSVLAQFETWTHTQDTSRASDEAASAAADDAIRMIECKSKLESSSDRANGR